MLAREIGHKPLPRAQKLQECLMSVKDGAFRNEEDDDETPCWHPDRAINVICGNGGFVSHCGKLWVVRVPTWLDDDPAPGSSMVIDRGVLEADLFRSVVEHGDHLRDIDNEKIILDIFGQDLSRDSASWREDLASLSRELADWLYEAFEPEAQRPVDGPEIVSIHIVRDLVQCMKQGAQREDAGDYIVFPDESFEQFWELFLEQLPD